MLRLYRYACRCCLKEIRSRSKYSGFCYDCRNQKCSLCKYGKINISDRLPQIQRTQQIQQIQRIVSSTPLIPPVRQTFSVQQPRSITQISQIPKASKASQFLFPSEQQEQKTIPVRHYRVDQVPQTSHIQRPHRPIQSDLASFNIEDWLLPIGGIIMGIILLLGIGGKGTHSQKKITPLITTQIERALTVCPIEKSSTLYVVNVRLQPSLQSTVIGQIPCYQDVQVIEPSLGGWTYIRSGTIIGYVADGLLKH